MKRKKLTKLLSDLDKKITIAQKQYKENEEAASQTAKTARSSWSSGGDREYAQGQAEINKERLLLLEDFKKQLTSAISSSIPEKVVVPCVVTIDENDEQNEDIYIVESPVSLEGYKLVSKDSPLGKYLIGKKSGERIDFNDGVLTGEIEEIQ